MRTIEDYIGLARKAVSEISYPEQPERLYEPIRYTMNQGGKRLRPALLLAACEAVSRRNDCEKYLPQAAAIEMFHNFTLLHDDVMDKADMRRGQPTVCSKWDENTAILSGDTMLTMASSLLVTGIDPETAAKLTDTFNRTAIGVYEGQQYDMDFEHREDVSIDEYINMIRLKTSVLIGGACLMGAQLAGANESQCDAIYHYAENLGLAFQLQDDLLDVYGDPVVFGKAIGGDILNNKKTFLLINALLLARDDDRRELTHWLHDPVVLPDEKIAAVTDIYNRLGADRICREEIDHRNREACSWIRRAGLDDGTVAFFENLAERLIGRSK